MGVDWQRMDCPSCGEGLQCVLCGADVRRFDEAAVERAAKALAGKPSCYCDDDWRVPKFEGCPRHGTGEWPADYHYRQAEAVLRAAGGQDVS
jgi:hypothetical protein